jgi:hypothetical protein
MAKTAAKKTKVKATPKRLSYKDAQIAYLSDGIGALERLVRERKVSRAALRKAVDALREAGAASGPLDQFVSTHLGTGRRGRAAPQVGSERTYRAQQLEQGSPFLRLPLDALNIRKGASVTVRFERDRIIISKS